MLAPVVVRPEADSKTALDTAILGSYDMINGKDPNAIRTTHVILLLLKSHL